MKRILLTVLALLPVSLLAQDTKSLYGNLPYHPYRKVGDRYYNLQPAYDWLRLRHIPRNKISSTQQKQLDQGRPMGEWIGVTRDNLMYLRFKVDQVLDDGLLVSSESSYPLDNTSTHYGRMFFLTNYPAAKTVVDGDGIQFLALKTGKYKYTDTAGAERTVDLYDYGIPYNPFEKSAVTNSTSKSATNGAAEKP